MRRHDAQQVGHLAEVFDAEYKVAARPASEEKVLALKIFLRTGLVGEDRLASGNRRSEEKVVYVCISDDNSSNLKIFLPERPLLT